MLRCTGVYRFKVFYEGTKNYSTVSRSELYKKCYKILGVSEGSDQNTVRRAYIDLVKLVHPDSCKEEASAERFQDIDKAFKILQEKFAKNRRGVNDDEEEKVFDIKHTAPQHRQYLNFEGIGVGTPFQRQKQYEQVKAIRAQDRVLNQRIEKAQAGEKSIIKKGGTYYKNHAIKTKYGFERIVEDLIQEAMSKGDFDNLSCSGKPLSSTQSQNPYLDFTTSKLNKILIDSGFTPEWIALQRDVREDIEEIKTQLRKERIFFGEIPLSDDEYIKWNLMLNSYETTVQRINKNIEKFNLIVPILEKQMFRVSLKQIGEFILKDPNIECNKNKSLDKDDDKKQANPNRKTDFFTFLGSLFS